jgi:Uma2 family endonuclease
MSWEEYQRIEVEGHCEYIDGCLVMNPSPAYRHQLLLRNLANLLQAACPKGYTAIHEWAWKPGADEWEPDIMVCERDDDAIRFTGTPQVIVEVLSTNRADDLVRKAFRYAAAGLPRYWIADPLEPSLRAYELQEGQFEEVAHAIGDDALEFDFGVGRVTVRPADLLR